MEVTIQDSQTVRTPLNRKKSLVKPVFNLDSYPDEFRYYKGDVIHQLEILEIPERRNRLVDVLIKLKVKPQLSLFSNERETLENILDGLLELRARGFSLYARFQSEIKGKAREISVANRCLDEFLRKYVFDIIEKAPCHESCHGSELNWTPNRSIGTHIPIGTSLSFDISDAHRSTNSQYVFDLYYRTLKGLVDDEDARIDAAGFLTMVSTVYHRDKGNYGLAQGSPVSAKIFNRILYPFDEVLYGCCLERRLSYTRWGDDFTISSRELDYYLRKILGGLLFIDNYFPIGRNKIYLQSGSTHYLLGHKIVNGRVTKASDEEVKNRNKLDLSKYHNGHSPEKWVEFTKPEDVVYIQLDDLPF